jgi:hypothetical protein
MISKLFPKKNGAVLRTVGIAVLMTVVVLGITMCAPAAEEAPAVEEGATLAILHLPQCGLCFPRGSWTGPHESLRRGNDRGRR